MSIMGVSKIRPVQRGAVNLQKTGAPALASSHVCGYLKSRYGGVRMKLELIRHVHVSEEYFTGAGKYHHGNQEAIEVQMKAVANQGKAK